MEQKKTVISLVSILFFRCAQLMQVVKKGKTKYCTIRRELKHARKVKATKERIEQNKHKGIQSLALRLRLLGLLCIILILWLIIQVPILGILLLCWLLFVKILKIF